MRKKSSEIDEKEVDQYVKDVLIFILYPWYLILNCDETPWNFVYLRGSTKNISPWFQ